MDGVSKIMSKFIASLMASLLMMASPALAAQKDLVGVASVIDGDTIEIHGVRIRLVLSV